MSFALISIAFAALLPTILLSGCSYARKARSLYDDSCKSHAYLNHDLYTYLSRRNRTRTPVRIAVIPYSVPANLAAQNDEFPGLGNKIAWKLHEYLLATEDLPITEVFNRPDWPRKKEEFFTGNFGAISFAREAGYDMVIVGYLDRIREHGKLAAYTKLMDVHNGITIWYGKNEVENQDDNYMREGPWWWFGTRRPDLLQIDPMVDDLASCISHGMLDEEDV